MAIPILKKGLVGSKRKINFSHSEINQMKTLARGYTYRPGIDKGTKMLVKVCLKHQNSASSFHSEKTMP